MMTAGYIYNFLCLSPAYWAIPHLFFVLYAYTSGDHAGAAGISFSIFIICYLLSVMAALFVITNLIISVARKKFLFSKQFTIGYLVSGLLAFIILVIDPAGLFVNVD